MPYGPQIAVLSTQGIAPQTAPSITKVPRPPTPNDYLNFNIGDEWQNTDTDIFYKLVSLSPVMGLGIQAVWQAITGGSDSAVITFGTDDNPVMTVGGAINLFGDAANITTHGINASHTIQIILNTSPTLVNVTLSGDLILPATGAGISLGGFLVQSGASLLNTYGSANTFLGSAAGSPTTQSGLSTNNAFVGNLCGTSMTDGSFNAALGSGALQSVTTDTNNVAVGADALNAISTTTSNTAVGTFAGASLLTGNSNTLIGYNTGANYVGAESNNILLGSDVDGTTAESNVIRIGNYGSQTATYIAGINGVTINPANINTVTIDTTTGQLGSTASAGSGGVNFTTTSGPTGTLSAVTFTGAGGISISSAGSTITFTGGGGGGGTLNTLTGNTGGAISPTSNNINIVGTGAVSVAGAGSTLTISVTTPLTVAEGGTGDSTLTVHSVLIGNGTSAVAGVGPGSTAGVPLVSAGSTANPHYSTALVVGGGTGLATLTAYSVLCGGTTTTGNVQQVSGVGTSGYVLTSNGSATLPTWQPAPTGTGVLTLTGSSGGGAISPSAGNIILAAGSNMTVTGSGNTITFAATSSGGGLGLTWTNNPANNTVMAPNNGYAFDNTTRSSITMIFPTVAAVGSVIMIVTSNGPNNYPNVLTLNAGQVIYSGSTQYFTGASVGTKGNLFFVCSVANTGWNTISFTNASFS